MSIECRTPFYNTLRSNEQSNPAPQPHEVLECSGLPWVGPKDSGWTPKQWPELKADTNEGAVQSFERLEEQISDLENTPMSAADKAKIQEFWTAEWGGQLEGRPVADFKQFK